MPDSIQVLLDTEELTVVGPPDHITVAYDVGHTGLRGSMWFTGKGMPGPNVIDYNDLNENDMYLDSNDGKMYQYILTPSGIMDWSYVGQGGGTGPAGQPTQFELRGTGIPYGTITPGAAGIYYTDTAGTNGAWRWISTGPSNSNWKVIAGDTGWRNVSPTYPVNPSAGGTTLTNGKFLVRRVNERVYLYVDSVTFSGDVTGAYYWDFGATAFPTAGFAAKSSGLRTPLVLNNANVGTEYRFAFYLGRYFYFLGSQKYTGTVTPGISAGIAGLSGETSWVTDQQWPTTLPGTAAV